VSIIDFYSEIINEDHGYSKRINKDGENMHYANTYLCILFTSVCYMGFMVRNEEEKSTDYLAHFSRYVYNRCSVGKLRVYISGKA